VQTKIEEFLKRNYPNTYMASEIGEEVKVSRSSALRQLKKLVAKGKAATRNGRYGWAPESPRRQTGPLQSKVEDLAGLSGIPVRAIEDWVEDQKAKKGPADSR
jgi:predicted transcriptional regulator